MPQVPPVSSKVKLDMSESQTTPPRTVRYKEWSKQVGAKCYIMNIWAKKEFVDLG